MTQARTRSLLSAVLVMLAVAGDRGQAEPYPSGPVKVISDSAPGSAPDAILRIVAERLSDAWGQQVVVMNQPGAGGAPVSSAFVTMKGAAPNIPIAVPADFAPISLIGEQPMFITIAPQTGIKTLPALIEAAKQKAGRNFLRRLRARPSKPSYRRDVAKTGRHQAADGPLFRRSGTGAERSDGRTGPDADRRPH